MMDKRGFESIEAMNEYMISQWNRKVRKNDEVVILGDFSVSQGEKTNELLRKLNGKKYLIKEIMTVFLTTRPLTRACLSGLNLTKNFMTIIERLFCRTIPYSATMASIA